MCSGARTWSGTFSDGRTCPQVIALIAADDSAAIFMGATVEAVERQVGAYVAVVSKWARVMAHTFKYAAHSAAYRTLRAVRGGRTDSLRLGPGLPATH